MSFSDKKIGNLILSVSDNIDTVHAFTTRYGGVSEGIYSSLNLRVYCDDERENIEENYKILCRALDIPFDRLVLSKQIHETNVHIAVEDDAKGIFHVTEIGRDGLITNVPNLPIIIFTADCIPVLLYDPVSRSVGAVHAGWRGTVSDIVGIAIEKMCENYGAKPENIHVSIGAGISKCCFETDGDVPEAVYDAIGENADRFVFGGGPKYHVDLKGINGYMAERRGVKPENIDISDECTMCLHDKYWSHRYTKGSRGTQGAVIMVRG